MTETVDPAAADLAVLTSVLHRVFGTSVAGAVMGRKRLRDEVTRQLGCSRVVGEALVDTMIARGLIRQQVHCDGWVYWAIRSS